ncbi:phosphomevalonate kinase [Microbacterium marinilacus]|uniref:phosphomevalonate kinase n=1 Tax=Microbacterium marinilacus TaxID=415209 RepID=A0ABP7BEF6_9MICO|nr:phosphomevalonate kinase [Microbacterium marinilacus]MBY0688881.1 phosphomevalonate kinase [Microbacterium marinilacus]
MIETRAPGKLFIAGEYAVVEPGQPAVLIAVDRYITVRLTEGSGAGRVHSREYGSLPLVWVRDQDSVGIVLEHHPYDYVVAAIAVAERLRAERRLAPRYFDLRIESELDDADGRKFGLGSSAAVVVATIAALDEFYGLALTRAERFKLALLATIQVAPSASGGDIAASTFGGWIRYSAPDRGALREHLQRHGPSAALESDAWAECSVTRLPHPSALRLLVGWTGSPAPTERLVDGVRPHGETAGGSYGAFLEESRTCVDDLVSALADDDGPRALAVVRRARRLLRRLGAASGTQIETEKLRVLCDVAEENGAAAKPSGAGGGDCGIVLASADAHAAALLRAWERHDIRRLRLGVHPAEGGVFGL